jgi:hypothetical protein
MEMNRDKKYHRQQGAGLVEFCFTIPILLLVAGATIDLSRYMRFLQITTFVSQETAGQIYRQCSDITIYKPPVFGSSGLRIDRALTETAVQACLERVQGGAQQLLNSTVGRAAVGSKVFRWKIEDPTVDTNCALAGMREVTEIAAKANIRASGITEETKEELEEGDCREGDLSSPFSQVNTSPIYMRQNSSPASSSMSDKTIAGLTATGIEKKDGGIYQTKNGSSQEERLLVTPTAMCQRGRVATVEVSYAFEPIVKFLPQMMIQLNTNGSQRETTVL